MDYRLNKRYRIKDAAQILGLNPSQDTGWYSRSELRWSAESPESDAGESPTVAQE